MPGVLLRRWRGLLEIAAVVAILFLAHGLQRQGAREAVATDQIARLTREKRVLATKAEVARVQYVTIRDTVRVRATRWDTLRVEARITDTVWVRAALASADTVIQGCRLALNRCDTLHRLDSLTIANRDSTIVATRSLLPTRADRVRGAVKWGAIGYGVAKAVRMLTR